MGQVRVGIPCFHLDEDLSVSGQVTLRETRSKCLGVGGSLGRVAVWVSGMKMTEI